MTAPVIVAGGGLAGAAAAALLARAGREVTVFEREATPVDKICGEFLSAEALIYLENLGLDIETLGGHRIGAVRLVRGARVVACALPFTGLGLSRRVLDEALLKHCQSCGATLRRGQTLRVLEDSARPLLRANDGEIVPAETFFLATGKHDMSRLRRQVSSVPDFVGLKLHMRLSPEQQGALSGHVEIIMLPTGYAGLQLIEQGIANLCLLVSRETFKQSGATLQALLAHLQHSEPHLARRLAGHTALFERPLSIANVPYGFVHLPQAGDSEHIFRLGDQAGVIPSFTGDGMSIALHSAVLAATCHLAGGSAARYHRRLRGDIARQIAFAGLLYRVSKPWPARAALMHVAALAPGILRMAARLTRVKEAVLF